MGEERENSTYILCSTYSIYIYLDFPFIPCFLYSCLSTIHMCIPFFFYLWTLFCFLCAGSLIQVPMSEKGKITRGRLGSLSLKKEGERQCFLFSKHLIICTRGSGGKLHLTKVSLKLLDQHCSCSSLCLSWHECCSWQQTKDSEPWLLSAALITDCTCLKLGLD